MTYFTVVFYLFYFFYALFKYLYTNVMEYKDTRTKRNSHIHRSIKRKIIK